MSYEGYVQCLCSVGHYFEYEWDQEEVGSCDCDRPTVWTNQVDDTNFEENGHIPFDLFEKHFRLPVNDLIIGTTYRIPSEEEVEKLRHYINGVGERMPISR